MISRRTIFSLLLTLLLALGLGVWAMGQWDECDALLAHGERRPSVYVESGTRTVEMPCDVWLPRQPTWFQMMCVVDLAFAGVFGVSACGDWVRWREQRKAGPYGMTKKGGMGGRW